MTTDGGRPYAGMSDKYKQIQKFVEILSGLVDRSEVISDRIAATVASNIAESSIESKKLNLKSKITNIRVNSNLLRKTPLRVVDMGSGMAYLTFATHSHLVDKFDLGELVREKNQIFAHNVFSRIVPY